MPLSPGQPGDKPPRKPPAKTFAADAVGTWQVPGRNGQGDLAAPPKREKVVYEVPYIVNIHLTSEAVNQRRRMQGALTTERQTWDPIWPGTSGQPALCSRSSSASGGVCTVLRTQHGRQAPPRLCWAMLARCRPYFMPLLQETPQAKMSQRRKKRACLPESVESQGQGPRGSSHHPTAYRGHRGVGTYICMYLPGLPYIPSMPPVSYMYVCPYVHMPVKSPNCLQLHCDILGSISQGGKFTASQGRGMAFGGRENGKRTGLRLHSQRVWIVGCPPTLSTTYIPK